MIPFGGPSTRYAGVEHPDPGLFMVPVIRITVTAWSETKYPPIGVLPRFPGRNEEKDILGLWLMGASPPMARVPVTVVFPVMATLPWKYPAYPPPVFTPTTPVPVGLDVDPVTPDPLPVPYTPVLELWPQTPYPVVVAAELTPTTPVPSGVEVSP